MSRSVFCREGLNHECVADLTYSGKERAQERNSGTKWEKLRIVRSAFFHVPHSSEFACSARNSAIQEFAGIVSGRNSPLFYFYFFILFFFEPVMAAELAVVLERRQSSQILLSLLELLSTFSRFIIVVWRRRAFHKRFPFHLRSSPRNYSSMSHRVRILRCVEGN